MHGGGSIMENSAFLPNEELTRDSCDTAEIVSKYKNVVFAAARQYSASADYEELVSDGFEALFRAIREYSPERGGFSAFAAACVKNAMLNTVRRAKKHSGTLADGADELENIVDPAPSPEELFIGKESNAAFFRKAAEILTELEMHCIDGIVFGLSYQEIADKLGIDRKAVDNAAARARAKLRKLLHEQ